MERNKTGEGFHIKFNGPGIKRQGDYHGHGLRATFWKSKRILGEAVEGNTQRSSRHPNCSFFTHWTSLTDSITWDVEVLADGDFEVIIYYTCPAEDVGSTFQLSFGEEKLVSKITEAHNPSLIGMENDRVERNESYVKDFKPLEMGTIHLKKDHGLLTLKALEIPGSQVMDFRLMMLQKKWV